MSTRLLSCFAICATCVGTVAVPADASAQTLSKAPVVDGWVPAEPSAKTSPFTAIFTDTARDFARVPSSDTAKLLAIGAAAAVMAHRVDSRLSHDMSESAGANTVFRIGETVGGARVQMATAVAAYAVGRLTNARTAAIGADLIRAQILAQTLTVSLKSAVGRTRPDGTQYSFPSGHTSTTFATATVLQRHLGWRAGIPAYAVASYVAASRIQDKRHFLSDVTFGAALGIVAGRTVTIGEGRHRLAISPTVVPGGGGVSFSLAD
jgi:hypothetical protein